MSRRPFLYFFIPFLSIYTHAPVLTSSDDSSDQSSTLTTQSNNLLTQIRDALTDDYSIADVPTFPLSWGFANALSSLDPSQSSSQSLTRYWSGENQYTQASINRIQFAQIVIDIILSRGVVSNNATASIDAYQAAYAAITSSTIEDTQDPLLNDLKNITEGLPSELTNLLVNAFDLKASADSCSNYWGSTSSSSTTFTAYLNPVGTVFTPPTTTPTSTNTTVNSCDRAVCSVAGANTNEFNGFVSILSNSNALKNDLSSLCNRSTYSGRPACGFIINLLDKGILDLPSGVSTSITNAELSNLSEDAGRSHIERLGRSVDSLIAPIQTLILTQIDQALTSTRRYPNTSFSSLYTPPAPASGVINTPNCQGPINSITVPYAANVTHCRPNQMPPDLPAVILARRGVDSFINNLVGMNAITTPIVPGPPLDISFTNTFSSSSASPPTTLKAYIAGQKITLRREPSGANYYWRSTTSKTVQRAQKYLYIPDNEGSEALTLQQNIRTNFYSKRLGLEASVSKALMTKSSALDIIAEIRNMNTTQQHFNVNGFTYSKTPLEILKESSQWRLKPSPQSTSGAQPPPNWLHEIAEMSNVALLREVAVLLAEMRQLQYLQLQTIQKQLLIQSISATKGTNVASNNTIPLETDVENYASGHNPSANGTANPPPGMPGLSSDSAFNILGAGAGQSLPNSSTSNSSSGS